MRLDRVKCANLYKFTCNMQPFTVIFNAIVASEIFLYFPISEESQARLSSFSIGMNRQHRRTGDVDIHFSAAMIRSMSIMLAIIYNV